MRKRTEGEIDPIRVIEYVIDGLRESGDLLIEGCRCLNATDEKFPAAMVSFKDLMTNILIYRGLLCQAVEKAQADRRGI